MSATGRAEAGTIDAGRTEEHGFTLIEMLVVLAVLGLVSGIAFPSVENAVAGQQFRRAAGEVEGALHAARASAIAGGTRTSFAPVDPPEHIAVELPRAGIAFYADGSASGGIVSVSGGARQVDFAVDAATGLIGRRR